MLASYHTSCVSVFAWQTSPDTGDSSFCNLPLVLAHFWCRSIKEGDEHTYRNVNCWLRLCFMWFLICFLWCRCASFSESKIHPSEISILVIEIKSRILPLLFSSLHPCLLAHVKKITLQWQLSELNLSLQLHFQTDYQSSFIALYGKKRGFTCAEITELSRNDNTARDMGKIWETELGDKLNFCLLLL